MGSTARHFEVPLAVVGTGALFPGSPGLAEFWRMVVAGRDQITEVPPHYWRVEDFYDPDPEAWGKTYARRGGFLPRVDFDPLEFGIPPTSLQSIDTVQLLTLLVARDVLGDCASYRNGLVDPDDVGVILGGAAVTEMMVQVSGYTDHPNWCLAMREAGVSEARIAEVMQRIRSNFVPWTEDTFPGLLSNVTAGRVTNRLGLGGTNCVVDAACASSLAALSMAAHELQSGKADLVVTGGSDAHNDIQVYLCFSRTPALSRTGDARPFSKQADGTILGEGVGLLALRRLPDAERDGDRIHAVIRGIGSSSDGRAKSIYAPRPAGQVLAFRRAYQAAGISPAEVELVEAHGTATRANDAAEVESLTTVYREADPSRRQWCALGSIKSQIGHTKGAAGAASLIKATLALRHGVLPPTIKVEEPNPSLGLDQSPFYLNTMARPWIHEPATTRKAVVNSLGFGGTNFHVVLEEYRGPAPVPGRVRASSAQLLLLSAADRSGLDAALEEVATRLATTPVETVVRQLHRSFDPAHTVRMALLAAGPEAVGARIAAARARLAAGGDPDIAEPGRMHLRSGPPLALAFLFPGQGSQRVDMGRDLAVEFEPFRAVWDQVAATDPEGGEALHRVVFPPPAFTREERDLRAVTLRDTRHAQPALGATALGYLALLERCGVAPAWVGGHSYGELVALHVAGVLPEVAQLIALSRARGRGMAEAAARAGASGMTAVLAPVADVEARLGEDAAGLTLANVNAPAQVVVAGSLEALDGFEARLAAATIRYRRLPVSAAFHSPHVQDAGIALNRALEEVRIEAPTIPVFANSTAAPYGSQPQAIRELLAGQLARPVRFRDQIEAMYDAGARAFVEVGPGRVLRGLVGEILGDREHLAVALDGRSDDGVAGFLEALGILACAGAPVRLEALFADFVDEAPTSPRAASKATVSIDGSNFRKAYPPGPDRPPAPLPRPPSAGSQEPSTAGEAPWLAALQEMHQSMATAQEAYRETLARGHEAFLKASGELLAGLDPARAGTGEVPLAAAAPARQPAPSGSASASASASTSTSTSTLAASEPEPLVSPAASTAPAPGPEDYERLMLDVLVELTGYPREALDMDLELEADLGVDSIKKVELFSEFQKRAPEVVLADPVSLFSRRTLRQIVEHVRAGAGGEPAPGGAAPLTPSSTAAAAPDPEVERWVLRSAPAEASCEALEGLGGRCIHLVGESPEVAAHLAAHLRSVGYPVNLAAEVPEEAQAVIFLAPLGSQDLGLDEATGAARAAFRTARRCGASLRDGGGVFVTVQDTGGDFNLSGEAGDRAWGGGLPALAKTVALEWPDVTIKAIDVDCRRQGPEDIAAAIFRELTEGGATREVGLQPGGHRLVPALVPRGLAGVGSPLAAGTVVLASGGARGITAACLVALARRSPLRIALVGSTPLEGAGEADAPRRAAVLETIRRLEEAGSEVRYLSLDIRDADSVEQAVAAIGQVWGPIQVLVHGAGINVDSSLLEKSEDEFEAVVSTKVQGLQNLLAATRGHPLTHLCCFSSVVARDGNLKQADYAVANEILNKICQSEGHARAGSCQVKSLLWGPWDGGMVQDRHRRLFELAGLPLLAMDVGATRFVRELEDPDCDGGVEVLLRATGAPPATASVH